MSTINILQTGKELPTNHITEYDDWLSKPYIMCSEEKFFLSDSCSKCGDGSPNTFLGFAKLQFPTPTSTIQLWAQFHSIIHFIWADIKELITELEISGSL